MSALVSLIGFAVFVVGVTIVAGGDWGDAWRNAWLMLAGYCWGRNP